ncbi:MAG: sigma-54-dependent Fis family transcriptional regulator [Thermodesulfobacteria bacterium]|nr:sigma-54-dependent Fis family transcriptional regulator [Thermodesulfobacteriota bacterium]
MTKKTILIVDDEESILDSIGDVLQDEGYRVKTASGGKECLEILESGEPVDLVLLDIWMPDLDGIEVLKKVKESWPFLPVIIMSGHGTIETAVSATKLGAHDFIEKPLSIEPLLISVENALKFKELQEENRLLKEKSSKIVEITGKSEKIKQLKEQIRIVAPTDAWILIQGENGTGKEIVAQTIHRLSKRSNRPMVEVNCAAIPDELIESELFGHEKGAFTGAVSMKRGKFDLANGGTLFLDEIGDMALKTQAKILRIIQEQKFERVGGSKTISVDVRIIAATNKNLEEEIKKGNFREDLYFRLNVIPIEVPPLRERKEDIPLLVQEFLNEFSKGTIEMEKEAIEALYNYDWPGNIRELRNLIERLVILSRGNLITKKDLPKHFLSGSSVGDAQVLSGSEAECFTCPDFKRARAIFEKTYLERKLSEFGGNIKRTAESIGIERRHLYRKIKSLGIQN